MTEYKVEVCKVKDVIHHPNADRLDIVTVKGWKCITGRDDHVVGDLVIFIPPDSLVTDAFVEKFNITYLKGKGTRKRIGAVKLRGEWSEGLVLPAEDGWKAGDDVAEHYNIIKWEPLPQRGRHQSTRGSKHMKKMNAYAKVFPKYTDIEHVRNYPDILEEDKPVWITEKIHGTNFRAGWVPVQGNRLYVWLMKKLGRGWKFLVGSRNVILDKKATTYYGENLYAVVAEKHNLKNVIPKGYILYGEIYGKTTSGADIQKGYSYSRTSPSVRFFDVSENGKYLSLEWAYNMLTALGLPLIPARYTIFKYEDLDTNLVRKSFIDDTVESEGVVIRPVGEERTHPRLGRVILKAISPAYLAQKERTEGH